MVELAIMIEGQNGLNWSRWQNIAKTVEELGFVGLYRSDHYTNPDPPDIDSLELWVSLTWLASHTKRIEFGPLVAPVSFRDPTMLARMASAVDDLSGGRLTLGMGAGWQIREHNNYGWDLLDVPARMSRLEEGLEVVTRLLNSDRPVDYEGEFYRLKEAILLPRPQRAGGPPVLIGGNGPRRTLPLAARYADEWNGVFMSPAKYAERNKRLDRLLVGEGRQPKDVRRSIMVGTLFGRDKEEIEARIPSWARGKYSLSELREMGVLAGTAAEISEQIGEFEEVGAQRLMLQWLDLDDLEGLRAFAEGVLG
ncbi:MAG: LLM class F420-dependent oxidoreductase [Candidatus Promineifilaceae bacterium]